MQRNRLIAAVLLLIQAFSTTATDLDAPFRQALLKELNNRTLASQVVSALADTHKGTPQGDFWRAYSELEAHQWPLYAEQATAYELSPGGFFLSLKARASILFAKAWPNRFVDMLSQATKAYAAELAALTPPTAQQEFWRYVIAQEQVQVVAFQHAAKQDYVAATAVIDSFIRSNHGAHLQGGPRL
ncbi:hypothetical protein [Pseudomonas sp. XK-1]|uniref:hypothetical protein n=1 Tax=Pseudomonas sp. XK-1 TaxID=3136019 RepID=UPI0031192759